MMNITIQHDKNKQRFFAEVEGQRCELLYEVIDEHTLNYYRTYVPTTLRQQGIAGQLAQTAMEYAKQHNFKIIPSCSYIQYYFKQHPEYTNLTK